MKTSSSPRSASALVHIDLTRRRIDIAPVPADVRQQFLAGRGLATYLLWEHGTDGDPVILCPGALAATQTPATSRVSLVARSPLSGGLLSETGGGTLAHALRCAGIAALCIVGRANKPCVIRMQDQRVQLVDATADMMRDTPSFADAFAGMATICAGPAARSNTPFSSLVIDRHFGIWRGGAGAVFAQKNLVGIAVTGSETPQPNDPARHRQICADIRRLIDASPALTGPYGFSRLGTSALLDLLNARRMLPTNNFRATFFSRGSQVNAVQLHRAVSSHAGACADCPVACKRIATRDNRALPNFESLAHFTALLENAHLETAIAADAICRQSGLNPTHCAARLAAMAEDAGTALSPDDILRQLRQWSAGHVDDLPDTAPFMAIKGMEMPPYDPRSALGLALSLATSTRGACHLEAWPIATEVLRKPVAVDRFSFAGKARAQRFSEDRNAAGDALGLCRLLFLGPALAEYADATTAVTGDFMDATGLLHIGARICYLERMLNQRFGLSPRSDTLPARFFAEPGTAGPDFAVAPIDERAFADAKARYYRIRGLGEDGLPTLAEAEKLGLTWK